MGNRLLTSCGISSSSVRAIDENQLLMDEHEKKSLERKETVMARIHQLLIVIGTIAAMILLIGCGQPTTTGTTGLFTATTTPSLRATNASTSIANPRLVTLQVDAPSAISPCRTKIATRIHSLAAKQNVVVRLIAPSNGWLPGVYYATLSYYSSLSLRTPTTIRSAAFTVGPFTPQP